jgi:UDP-2-acetamido-2,6-beta-L-arabino-hexul-4-ose reductase
MKILVTGADGFLAKNLCVFLKEISHHEIVEVTRLTRPSELLIYLEDVEFIYHFAGVNRSESAEDFQVGNVQLTEFILDALIKKGRKTPIAYSSSTQAALENIYGKSKLKAEEAIQSYSKITGAPYYISRFPNLFGKWSKPNYNSFVSTFCYNTVNGIDIEVHNPKAEVTLAYIDDVCESLLQLLDNNCEQGFYNNYKEYYTTVGDVADIIGSFKDRHNTLFCDRVGTGLVRALYSTFLSYITPDQFAYEIPTHADERGVFCEMLKTKDSGQFSFFTAFPGVTRGGHYHHTKNEKFLVIKGIARFRFKQVVTGEMFELTTSEKSPKIVETIPGWAHDITNIGDNDLIVLLWANEIFNRELPDTIAKRIQD